MVAPEIMLALTDLPEDLHVAWMCSLPTSCCYFLSHQRRGFEAGINVCGQDVNGFVCVCGP